MRVFVFVWGTELQRDSNVPLVVLYCSGAYSPFYIFIFCLQDSEKLLALCRSEGGQISLSLGLKPKRHPLPHGWCCTSTEEALWLRLPNHMRYLFASSVLTYPICPLFHPTLNHADLLLLSHQAFDLHIIEPWGGKKQLNSLLYFLLGLK